MDANERGVGRQVAKNPVNKQTTLKAGAAVVLLAVAAFFFVKFYRNQREPEGLAYFYDLSERKLFVAPRTAVPPIRGINDEELDGMRAVVISISGDPKDKQNQKIAYLEKYSPELKQQFERMRDSAAGKEAATNIGRGQAQAHIFVRRVNESDWHPANSPEAEKIMTEWLTIGVNGKTPAVCIP